MGGKNFMGGRRRWAAAWTLTTLAALAALAAPGLTRADDNEVRCPARADDNEGAVVPERMPRGEAKPDKQDPEIVQTGCASCGNGLLVTWPRRRVCGVWCRRLLRLLPRPRALRLLHRSERTVRAAIRRAVRVHLLPRPLL